MPKSPRPLFVLAIGFCLAQHTWATFDAREATIASTQHSLYTGLATCREVVSSFLSRIEALNNRTNAIISLNPNALAEADACDEKLLVNNATLGPLFCVPTLLKDNYDTADLPTTGGNLDLASSRPSVDAPAVAALKNAGAIILGKSNLHELALEGLSVSSLGGQTINPYDSTRTPGGSSGARCVEDVATALTIMASVGYDSMDNATALVPPSSRGLDYTTELTKGSLEGLRLGLLEGFMNMTNSPETTAVNEAMANITSRLLRAGATIVPIKDSLYNATALAAFDTQRYEYREEMDAYLQRQSLGGRHPQTLNELYNSSRFLVIPSQYEYVTTSLVSSTGNQTWNNHLSYSDVQRGIANLTLALRSTFAANHLDAMIYPEQKNLVVPIGSPSQSGRNGILAALTGSPVVTIPVGFSSATATAPEGVPIGMEILGLPWSEEMLLQTAYQIEQLARVRKTPVFAKQVVETRAYQEVPVVKPNTGNISPRYPIGVL
ncbi:hypothetical protein LTR86_006029 [Recurvomyces mirabilis]|nr:hypothetical protein LTR86_006029 [Recurvomyces mirabilis]